MILGCSSDDETEDPKADVGPTSSIVEDTGPKGPEMIYIATGMDDLNQQKLPDYLKEDLGLVSAEVTVETPDSKWRIVADGKVYEIQYRVLTMILRMLKLNLTLLWLISMLVILQMLGNISKTLLW